VRSALSDEDRELVALPSIASQMPVRFANGACWERFDGQCKACGKDIDAARLTGKVTRPMESVATVEAVGVCPPCKLVTRFHYRLHNDMRISGPTDEGWAAWQAKPSIFDRLRKFALREIS
jgi:hypothetical protein